MPFFSAEYVMRTEPYGNVVANHHILESSCYGMILTGM